MLETLVGRWLTAVLLLGCAAAAVGAQQVARVEMPAGWADAHAAALRWLAAQQRADGSWLPPKRDASERGVVLATTALALLALHSGGSTMRAGPHKVAIRSGVVLLRDLQDQVGWFDGPGPVRLEVQALASLATAVAATEAKSRTVERQMRNGSSAIATGLPAENLPADRSFATALSLIAARRCLAAVDDAAVKPWAEGLQRELAKRVLPTSLVGSSTPLPFRGPLADTREMESLAALMALRGAVPAGELLPAPRAQWLVNSLARWGDRGELVDGFTVWFTADLAAGVPAIWPDVERAISKRLLPRQITDGADAGRCSFDCGFAFLDSAIADTALLALALATPVFAVGR